MILVLLRGEMSAECAQGIRELHQLGHPIRQRSGRDLDEARNLLATTAIAEGFTEWLWVDSCSGFHPSAVAQLRSHQKGIVGAACVSADHSLDCHFLPATTGILLGSGCGLVEVASFGFRFVLTQAQVFRDLAQYHRLPKCRTLSGEALIPFFMPESQPVESGFAWRTGEHLFCERVRRMGASIWIDASLRIRQWGTRSELLKS